MLTLYTAEIKEYLKYDDVVDFDKPEVKALADKLFAEAEGETDFVRRAYEYVRDTFPHSADINADEVAVSASDVLKIGHGICHAKAHLLAAILRSHGVPAGFCYQKLILDDETSPVYISHGLNGVYLREYDKWIRLDSRGNRSDVDAQFSVDEEKLAFPVRAGKGEEDDLTVYADPKVFVIKSMRESKTRTELWINLPVATCIDSMKIEYRQAVVEDAELLVDIYNASFYDDYVRFGVCPGYGIIKERMEESIREISKYVILCDDKPVGCVAGKMLEEGEYEVACLCIIPEYQGKGIGTQAIRFLKTQLEDWKMLTLVTPIDKKENVKFYTEKCGFRIESTEKDGDVELYRFVSER